MKKIVLFFATIVVSICITSCRVDEVEPVPNVNPFIVGTFLDGVISINEYPGVNIEKMNVFPEGKYVNNSKSSLVKSNVGDGEELMLPSNQYRFKLVAQMSKLDVERNGKTYGTQATHVKITNITNNVGYAYVTYNHKDEPNIGGIVLYKFTVVPGTLEEADVQIQAIQSMEMETAQLNAIDYDPDEPNKLYVCGATDRPSSLGLSNRAGGKAFFMILEIDPSTKKFSTTVEPVIRQLTSYQATSIRKYKDNVYITVGDGKMFPRDNDDDVSGSDGGLYIFNKDGTQIKANLGLKHARSVDADETGIYLFQSNHARVTKFDLNGHSPQVIYNAPNNAMQRDAKSEIMLWKDYLFASENETGLKMLFKNGGVNESIAPPNFDSKDWDKEVDVTNSVSMNSDEKIIFLKDRNGNTKSDVIQSDLLLVANGGQGIYWYDITKASNRPDDDKDYISASDYNSILKGSGSANFVTSRGNVVFVADGLGGLKVLYIGQNLGDTPPPIGIGCDSFMGFLYYGGSGISPLFPETRSVFRNDAHNIVKQLFQLDVNGIANRKAARDLTLDYIEIINDTELYITFLLDGAGYYNSLGFFVLPPKKQGGTDKDDWDYFNSNIKSQMVNNTTNNYLKPEYTIFKSIAGVDATNKKNGNMVGGSVYSVGNGRVFKKGERVVLFMCPDGFNSQNNQAIVDFRARIGTTNNYKCIFFMNKYFNEQLGIRYNSVYGDFAGQQFNTVYSADCKGMIICIEDMHVGSSDVDFNDIIFTLSDNMLNKEVQSFKAPYWAIEGVSTTPRIFPTKEIFGVITAFD